MDSSGPSTVQSLNPPALIPDYSRVIQKLPETLTPSEEENIPGPPEAGEDAQWETEENGIEVWSGEDASLGDMLVASLRENEIGVHRENASGKQSLVVSAQQEARAREIVKEVVEGVPPE